MWKRRTNIETDIARAAWSVLRQAGDCTCRSRQFEDVQTGIGAVDDVDVAAVVGLDVVGLDRDLAALAALDRDAALVGRSRDRRNEVADFPGVIGIADVE